MEQGASIGNMPKHGKIDLAWKIVLFDSILTELPDMNETDGEILTLGEVAVFLKAGKKTAMPRCEHRLYLSMRPRHV